MPVLFNSNKIIPVEFITISYDPTRDPTNNQLATRLDIQIRGKLSATKGSPNSSGVFWNLPDYPPDEDIPADGRLGSILAKQKALKNLFKADYGSLEIQPW